MAPITVERIYGSADTHLMINPARPRPYVGISGFTAPAQQARLVSEAERLGLLEDRDLLLGVKAVHKTQFLDVANKYGREWYPVGDEFESVLEPSTVRAGTVNVAQIFLDETDQPDKQAYRTAFMDRVLARGCTWLDGVQFDMLDWHTDPSVPDFLAGLKADHGVGVYLQAHGPAMSALGPDGVATALAAMASCVDYVLFDASHGTGTRMDVAELGRFVAAGYATAELNHVGFAIAGGLNATAVAEDLPSVLSTYPDLSWDAEGALHPVQSDGTRPLDMALAGEYLSASAATLA